MDLFNYEEKQPMTTKAMAAADDTGTNAAMPVALAVGDFEPTLEQAAAINEFDRDVLVISLPGTGKTSIVTLKHTAAVERWGPGAAISVTFTKKASSEIKARLRATGAILPGRSTGPDAGTFHSIAARVLSMATALGYYDGPTVIGTPEELDQVLDDARSEPRPTSATKYSSTKDVLKGALDKTKNMGMIPVTDGYATVAGPVLPIVEGLPNPGCPTHDAMVEYQRRLGEQRMLDYDDALIQATLMLRQHRKAMFPRLKAVIVDEFQDVNKTNMMMVEALSDGLSLTCCGDDDQAIYHWRGARVEHIQKFPERRPGALVIVLRQNFRSVAGIPRIAGRIMHGVPGRLDKAIPTTVEYDDALPMTLHPYQSRSPGYNPMGSGYEAGLAEFTATVCRRALRNDRDPDDLIVLVRTNDQAKMVREQIEKSGQPARISNPNALDSLELRSLVSWLRLMSEPAADGPVHQLANVPKGDTTMRDLGAMARQSGTTLIDLLVERHRQGKLRAPRLCTIVEQYVRFATDHETLEDAALVDRICHAIATRDLVSTDQVKVDHFWRAYASILPGLQGGHGLRSAIEELQTSLSDDELGTSKHAIEVSTAHSVKGRQKPLVVISAFADGIMPGRMSLAAGMRSQEMEDERRLAYVSVSRAREHVHIITVANARSCLASLATNGGRDGGTVWDPKTA